MLCWCNWCALGSEEAKVGVRFPGIALSTSNPLVGQRKSTPLRTGTSEGSIPSEWTYALEAELDQHWAAIPKVESSNPSRRTIALSSNGRMPGSDPGDLGSSPSGAVRLSDCPLDAVRVGW
jgi:hypothetical protein